MKISPDAKELNEHQLAPVPKADKKGQNQRDKNKQANNHDSPQGQNTSFQRGQSGYRPSRGRSNQRGGFFRGRGSQYNTIKGIIIEAEASQEEAEGMTIAIMVTAIIATLEVGADPFKDDHGGYAWFSTKGKGLCTANGNRRSRIQRHTAVQIHLWCMQE